VANPKKKKSKIPDFDCTGSRNSREKKDFWGEKHGSAQKVILIPRGGSGGKGKPNPKNSPPIIASEHLKRRERSSKP